MLSLLNLLCFHQSLPGNGSQQCPLLPSSRPYRLVTVSQLTHYANCWLSTATHSPLTMTVHLQAIPSPHWLSRVREPELLYDWRFTANQFVLASSLLRLTTRVLSFGNWTLMVIVLVRLSTACLAWLYSLDTDHTEISMDHIENTAS
jgi:hypothetical protein